MYRISYMTGFERKLGGVLCQYGVGFTGRRAHAGTR